ncbi:hypothetical protein FACS1894188_02580 [Clostridia bacterium]|nr:hypothetical protein FACS1894188_02580 [Clostridia bacterium]
MPDYYSSFDHPAIKLSIKSDGVYLNIDKTIDRNVRRSDVTSIITYNQVKEIDFVALNDLFKAPFEKAEIKISGNKNVLVQREDIDVEVSEDKLEAYAVFKPPVNSNERLTPAGFFELLDKRQIIFGVDRRKIGELFDRRQYGVKYLVAEGAAPVDGIDGKVQYHFDTSKKTLQPKQLDNGKVDYKELNLFQTTLQGGALITLILPVQGSDGITVLGRRIPHKKAKPVPIITKGSNVVYSDADNTFYAAESGQIVFKDKKISIMSVLEINGNVDNSTGNISFVGSVVIKGGVLSGFTVETLGNVEIYGILEDATIIAGGDIILYSGAQGRKKAVLIADGDIRGKYLTQCNVYCQGDIRTDSLMHCVTQVYGNIFLSGKSGILVGGRHIVRQNIYADIVGAAMSAKTEIVLGYIPNQFVKYKELVEKIDELTNEMNSILGDYKKESEKIKGGSKAAMEKVEMNQENIKNYYGSKIEDLTFEMNQLDYSSSDYSFIIAKKIIYGGTRIRISDSTLILPEDCTNSKVCVIDKRVTPVPMPSYDEYGITT